MAIAFEKAQTLETAQKNAQVLKGQVPSLAVGQVSKHPPASRTDQSGRGHNSASRGAQRASCHRYGGKGHIGRDYNFREATCHKCAIIIIIIIIIIMKSTVVQNPRHVILYMTIQITFWFRYYYNYNKLLI